MLRKTRNTLNITFNNDGDDNNTRIIIIVVVVFCIIELISIVELTDYIQFLELSY